MCSISRTQKNRIERVPLSERTILWGIFIGICFCLRKHSYNLYSCMPINIGIVLDISKTGPCNNILGIFTVHAR